MDFESDLNQASLDRLLQIGGKEFAVQMMDLFVSFVPPKLAEAKAAAAEGDLGRVEKAVHSIKSSAANLGARSMRDLAARIEELARDRRGEAIEGLLSQLEAAYDQAKVQLQARREGLAAKKRRVPYEPG